MRGAGSRGGDMLVQAELGGGGSECLGGCEVG